jgi:hypothetical protein
MLRIELNKVKELVERDIQQLLLQLIGKSDLVDDIKVEDGTNELTLYVNDYIKFIESGRRPKSKKIPISVLAKWSKKKGIGLSNSELFAVQNSIFVKGIVGKKNINKKITEQFNNSFERYYKAIVEDDIEKQIDNLIDKIK